MSDETVPEEQVILVDEHDEAIGVREKQRAHLEGVLHRAFSVFVFNERGELLLQRRAASKYHSGALWTNTCCSHPRPGESIADAARRRLRQEMGVECALEPLLRFRYRAALANGLIEHEIDHVLTGRWSGMPHPDPAEVDDWRWCAPAALDAALAERPHEFTAWLPIAWARLRAIARP